MPNTFIVHHLTDIHVGPLHYTSNAPLMVPSARQPRNIALYQQHLQRLPISRLPDLVIISGDLTTSATEPEMNAAQDALAEIVRAVKRKAPVWRTGRAPYLLVVPGNHDLDWGKDDYHDKVERYSRMADALHREGEVLSAVYRSGGPTVWDFGAACNVFVSLFNTVPLGGVLDPVISSIHTRLKHMVGAVQSTQQSDFLDALQTLAKEMRKDPGYLSNEELARGLPEVPPGRLGIAVMHHNPSSVPSDDIETFDAIINAGKVKAALLKSGYDLVFHGHRHFLHCVHERFLGMPDGQQEGIFILSGDSLGCKETAPFLEVRLTHTDTPYERDVAPSLFEVRSMEHHGGSYSSTEKPFVEEVFNRGAHRALSRVVRLLGRALPESLARGERELLLDTIQRIQPQLRKLQLDLVGWGQHADDWIRKFHFQLEKYGRVYATDAYRRLSSGSKQFDVYLRRQYGARLKSLRAAEAEALVFSEPVYDAIVRTGWRAEECVWTSSRFCSGEPTALEIVRILVRPKSAAVSERDDLLSLDFDHQAFAIPLFVVAEEELADASVSDFAIGMDEFGNPEVCFEFQEETGRVDDVDPNSRGVELLGAFQQLLQNRALRTVKSFLGERTMIRDPGVRKSFAENYDKTRGTSPTVVEALKTYLQPDRTKRGLDIACGTGNYTIPFIGQFQSLTGIDELEEMLAVAKNKTDAVHWIHANALDTGLPPASFDAIWCVSSLHYFTRPQQRMLFQEMFRLLKPAGVFVADTEFLEQHESLWLVEYFPWLGERFRNALLSTEEHRDLAMAAGFAEVACEHFAYPDHEADGVLRVGQRRPELYLEERIRQGIPAFVEMPQDERLAGLDRLRGAIRRHEIHDVIDRYTARATVPGDFGLVVAYK